MIFPSDLRFPSLIKHQCDGSALCRIGQKEFRFVLTIVYAPAESLLEFIEYEKEVKLTASMNETTIEELADMLFGVLWQALKPSELSLTLEAYTTVHGDASITIARGGAE
jgi:hypothetical protein